MKFMVFQTVQYTGFVVPINVVWELEDVSKKDETRGNFDLL